MAVKPIAPNTLRLRGELTIRTIADAYQKLTVEYANPNALCIDLSEVGEADLTLVQLVESARRSSTKDGKRTSLAGMPSAAVFEVLERGGFLGTTEDVLFWKNSAP